MYCEFPGVTVFFKGGSAPKPPPPPKPPTPSTAAENVSRLQLLERQRQARGFTSTYLTQGNPPDRPLSMVEKLLQ